MIIHSFDTKSEPIATTQAFYGEQKHICDTCIVTFSREIFDYVLENYNCPQIDEIKSCCWAKPICLLEVGGKKFAFILAYAGAVTAATDVIETWWKTGATKFIMFGSAGSLNSSATTGKYVIPTEAYRDEGISYHYAPPADFIKIANAERVAEIFNELKVPLVCGRVWTTDAIYRETKNLVEQHRNEGCIAVEMELAGVQAVCDFHGLELYNFLVTGDVLDSPEYDASGLNSANHSLDKFNLALEIAARI